jgi:hypothetical protein
MTQTASMPATKAMLIFIKLNQVKNSFFFCLVKSNDVLMKCKDDLSEAVPGLICKGGSYTDDDSGAFCFSVFLKINETDRLGIR